MVRRVDRERLAPLFDNAITGAQRVEWWRKLGLGELAPVVVMLFHTPQDPESLTAEICAQDPECVAVAPGSQTLVITRDEFRLRQFAQLRAGLRAGIGGKFEIHEMNRSYVRARDALQLTQIGSPLARVVSDSDVGTLLLLARIPPRELLRLPDVKALRTLRDRRGGAEKVEALEALCRRGSLRAAADALHLHHSSVASRIEAVEEALDYRLNEPISLVRAYVALLALRLIERDDADDPPGTS